MSFPQYRLRVWRQNDGALLTWIPLEQAYSMQFDRLINKIGALSVTLLYEPGMEVTFATDNIVDVDRRAADGNFYTEASFFVRFMERFEAADGERMLIGGKSVTDLLARRVINPADDPLAVGGYSTKAGATEQIIREYIREQAGDLASAGRQTLRLTVPSVITAGTESGLRLRWKNLWDEMSNLGDANDVDIEVIHTGAANFECFIGRRGSDKSVPISGLTPFTVFSPQRRNVVDPRLTIDRRKEATFIYTLGDGDQQNRTVLETASTRVADSAYNRIEITSDARQADKKTVQQLITEAIRTLNDNAPEQDFDFKLEGNAGGAVYREDFDLGDTVTIVWDELQVDRRIVGISFELDGQTEIVKVKIGETK